MIIWERKGKCSIGVRFANNGKKCRSNKKKSPPVKSEEGGEPTTRVLYRLRSIVAAEASSNSFGKKQYWQERRETENYRKHRQKKFSYYLNNYKSLKEVIEKSAKISFKLCKMTIKEINTKKSNKAHIIERETW
jgi:hypothetical protein